MLGTCSGEFGLPTMHPRSNKQLLTITAFLLRIYLKCHEKPKGKSSLPMWRCRDGAREMIWRTNHCVSRPDLQVQHIKKTRPSEHSEVEGTDQVWVIGHLLQLSRLISGLKCPDCPSTGLSISICQEEHAGFASKLVLKYVQCSYQNPDHWKVLTDPCERYHNVFKWVVDCELDYSLPQITSVLTCSLACVLLCCGLTCWVSNMFHFTICADQEYRNTVSYLWSLFSQFSVFQSQLFCSKC